MAIEIEYKFKIKNDIWRQFAVKPRKIRQAYLAKEGKSAIRVRIYDNNEAKLTIKAAVSGATRKEFEYAIPIADAEELMHLASGYPIEKTRYTIPQGSLTWEIDEFFGENNGLIIAEIELSHEIQEFEKPSWVGEDVTDQRRYYNSNLTIKPFSQSSD